MRLIRILSLLLFFALALPVFAHAEMVVAEGVIATAVADRAPAGVADVFPSTVGKLYCFTRLTGAGTETEVTHVWYRGDQEMARVALSVRSDNWRSWSSKQILPEWAGAWRVEVLDAGGTLLQTIPFTVQ